MFPSDGVDMTSREKDNIWMNTHSVGYRKNSAWPHDMSRRGIAEVVELMEASYGVELMSVSIDRGGVYHEDMGVFLREYKHVLLYR